MSSSASAPLHEHSPLSVSAHSNRQKMAKMDIMKTSGHFFTEMCFVYESATSCSISVGVLVINDPPARETLTMSTVPTQGLTLDHFSGKPEPF